MSVVSRLGVTALALAMYSTVSATPHAVADPPAKAPCAVLNQIRGSLDDDISGGIDGARMNLNNPFAPGSATTNVSMISHGIHYMQDLNGNNVVPGLAPRLSNLERAANDMRDAVFALGGGGSYGYGSRYGSGYSWPQPQPSTWAAIDYTEQKKNDVYALVNDLQGNCAP